MPTRHKNPKAAEGKRAIFIGQWFRNRRVELRRTIGQCAKLSGYSVSMHSEMERGLYDPMRLSIKAIPAFSRAYNVRPEAILWRMGIIEAPSTSDWKKIKKLMEADAQEEKEA